MKRAKKLPSHAPRNPLVAAAKFRKAGAHGKSEKALRREAQMKSKNWSSTDLEQLAENHSS